MTARGESPIDPALRLGPAFPNEAAFFLRFFLPVGALRDEVGRPLHEVDFRESLPPGEYRECRFRDSRAGYLINEVALRQMAAVWDEIVALASRCGALMRAGREGEIDRRALLWRASLAAMFLPVYLSQRSQSAYYGKPIPVSVAALFKVALDLPTTIDLLLLAGQGSGGHVSSDAEFAGFVADFADSRGILLNGRYACAGPRRLMIELIEAFVGGQVVEGSETVVCVGDPDEYRDYCLLMTVQYVIGYWFGLASGLLSERRFRRAGLPGNATPPATPSAYERRRGFALTQLSMPNRLAAALLRYREVLAGPTEMADYFDVLWSICGPEGRGRAFEEGQRALEAATEVAIVKCQALISARFGIEFAQPPRFADFWENLPRNVEL